jgi:hypothetical protein
MSPRTKPGPGAGQSAAGALFGGKARPARRRFDSLPNDLHQRPLPPQAVEFAVENLLPRAEVEFAGGDGHDDLAAHDGALQVGVGIILAGAVVRVGGVRLFWRELFQPALVVAVEPGFVVVDEDGGS